MKRRLKRILARIRAYRRIRTGSNHGKSRLRMQNRRIQPTVIASHKCWRIAQGRICPDSLKRCSASSLDISLSRHGDSLFGVRSKHGRLLQVWLIWDKWACFTLAAYAKNGRDGIGLLYLMRCFRVSQITPNCAAWLENCTANKAL